MCLNLHYVPKMCLKVPVHPYLQVYVCLLCNPTRPMTKQNIIRLACSKTCSKCRELQVGKSRVYPELCVCKIGVWPQICWHGRKIRASAEQHTQPIIHPPCNPEYLAQGWILFLACFHWAVRASTIWYGTIWDGTPWFSLRFHCHNKVRQ